jgi:hypothetical protein
MRQEGNIMDSQYSIINQCLQLLTQSDMPTIKKLRVEIQLLQMKRLLLNDAISNEIHCGTCGEEFEGLLSLMRRICGGGWEGGGEGNALPELMDRLGGMLTVLSGNQASR